MNWLPPGFMSMSVAALQVVAAIASHLLMEDGTSRFLLEDGTSTLLLEA